ncbi:pilin N-terminal domain-containing protein [Enterococcus gilvus]|uniref:pilin N-terminal domain-containing protein n=1 Tax=Enterococcus gilvus TaxID=160453 RepID=UPI003D6BFBE2
MRKKQIFWLIIVLLIPVGSLIFSSESVRAEATDLSITIVKYKITDDKQTEGFPVDGTKAALEEEHLTPLPGIQYRITRVSPIQGSTDFQPVEGVDAFSTVSTTDTTGSAKVSNLVQGTYKVEEQPNPLLSKVMDPVVLELPLPQPSGPALKEVYLYPKSSVTTTITDGKTPTTGKTSAGESKTASSRLPQTSGTIGTSLSLMLILGFLMVMGLLGWVTLKKKNTYK